MGYVASREASGDERLRARVENVGFGSVDTEAVLGMVEAAIRDPLLSRYGVDWLVAVELRNWLSSSVKAKVSVFEILQSASITESAAPVAGKSAYVSSKGLAEAQLS